MRVGRGRGWLTGKRNGRKNEVMESFAVSGCWVY